MLHVDIPGYKEFNFKNIIFDYNGTLAVGGKIDLYTRKKIIELSRVTNIYVLTADTYGNVQKECGDLPLIIKTFPCDKAANSKKDIVTSIDGESICIGNGYNDIEMFKVADLSICIIGGEGCSGKLLSHSDIVVNSRESLFELFFYTDRIRATLRG